jgi:hypothetical protein
MSLLMSLLHEPPARVRRTSQSGEWGHFMPPPINSSRSGAPPFDSALRLHYVALRAALRPCSGFLKDDRSG